MERFDRRNFIKGGLALGGLASAVPLKADLPRVDFGERGWYERMQMAYRVVRIGLPKPFSVLHISDTHLTAAYSHETKWREFSMMRTKIFGGYQEQAIAESLKWAKSTVSLTVHTGDLIDFQSEANLDLVRKYVGESDEVLWTCGNHEFHVNPKEVGVEPTQAFNDLGRAALRQAFGRDLGFAARMVNGVNFVVMDNVYGYVTEQQVAAFSQEVKKGLPIVLGVHVPLFTENIRLLSDRYHMMGIKVKSARPPAPEGDCKRQLEDPVTRDFLSELRSEKLLVCVLSGHYHHFAEDRFSPTAMEYLVGGNYLFHGQEILFV